MSFYFPFFFFWSSFHVLLFQYLLFLYCFPFFLSVIDCPCTSKVICVFVHEMHVHVSESYSSIAGALGCIAADDIAVMDAMNICLIYIFDACGVWHFDSWLRCSRRGYVLCCWVYCWVEVCEISLWIRTIDVSCRFWMSHLRFLDTFICSTCVSMLFRFRLILSMQ